MRTIEDLIAAYKAAAIEHALSYGAAKAMDDEFTAKTHLSTALQITRPLMEYRFHTDPESYEFHALSRNCGWYLTRLGREAEAAEIAKRALEHDPPESMKLTFAAIIDNAELPEYTVQSEFE